MSTSTPQAASTERRELPAPGKWSIDPTHSRIQFAARHMMISRVRGHFSSFSGTIEIAPDPTQSSVEAVIQAASIDTGDKTRDSHVRSADFLDVQEYPEIRFRSTAVRPSGDSWEVDGDLTVKNLVRPVTLRVDYTGTATDPWGGKRAGFEATTVINREDFGVMWNQVLEAGELVVGKEIKVELDIEAVLEDPSAADS
jgi:polyisoprenoid-binding protein YceI